MNQGSAKTRVHGGKTTSPGAELCISPVTSPTLARLEPTAVRDLVFKSPQLLDYGGPLILLFIVYKNGFPLKKMRF